MRYRLRLATWTVVRERGEPSPRILSDPEAAARLALDLARASDDDKEHVWSAPDPQARCRAMGGHSTARMYPASAWSSVSSGP